VPRLLRPSGRSIIRFHVNGDGGALAELADKVLDREWLVDGMDIRDFMPNPGNPPSDITA